MFMPPHMVVICSNRFWPIPNRFSKYHSYRWVLSANGSPPKRFHHDVPHSNLECWVLHPICWSSFTVNPLTLSPTPGEKQGVWRMMTLSSKRSLWRTWSRCKEQDLWREGYRISATGWLEIIFKSCLRIKWNISGQPAKDDVVCGLSMRISSSTGWLF